MIVTNKTLIWMLNMWLTYQATDIWDFYIKLNVIVSVGI